MRFYRTKLYPEFCNGTRSAAGRAARDPAAGRLSSLIEKVLQNPSYRERADYFQKVISETRGLDVAADIIEQAFQKYQTEVPRDSRSVARGKPKTAEEMQEA